MGSSLPGLGPTQPLKGRDNGLSPSREIPFFTMTVIQVFGCHEFTFEHTGGGQRGWWRTQEDVWGDELILGPEKGLWSLRLALHLVLACCTNFCLFIT